MQTYEDTLKYLDSLTNYELSGFDPAAKKYDLEKLKNVLEKLGNPQRSFRSVHVAGTKGKGSVCTFAASILEEAGLRTGLFTSPHLESVRERIGVGGEAISEEDLARTMNGLKEHLGHPGGERFTFFEALTLAAIVYFSDKKVDCAVFEVGMGGRFDATNIIDAEVCGISPVSYDHMNVLGNTLEEISREKAAIIKKKARCVSSPQRAKVLSVIKNKCLEEEASLAVVGKDIICDIVSLDEKGSRFSVRGSKGFYEDCRVNMPGEFQAFNCATAIGICEEFLGKSPEADAVKRAAARAFIPGRLEVLSRGPLVVIDGAQNEESALRLKESVEKIFKYKKLILVLGFSKDKDIEGFCRQLVPQADEVIVTKASVERAADPMVVRGYIKDKPARVTRDVKEALGAAFSRAGKGDMILAAGSFYVIGEIRTLLNEYCKRYNSGGGDAGR